MLCINKQRILIPTLAIAFAISLICNTSVYAQRQHSSDFYISNSHGVNRGSYFYVYGDVNNSGSRTIENVNVIIKVYDDDRQLIDTFYVEAHDNTLYSGDSSKFTAYIYDKDLPTFNSISDIRYFYVYPVGDYANNDDSSTRNSYRF